VDIEKFPDVWGMLFDETFNTWPCWVFLRDGAKNPLSCRYIISPFLLFIFTFQVQTNMAAVDRAHESNRRANREWI
jgi:hypothetical protein